MLYKEEEEKKFYAVKNGRKTGIFETWAECKEQVHGFKGCKFKSFLSYEEAEEYLTDVANANHIMPGQLQIQETEMQETGIPETEKQEPVFKNIVIYVVGKAETKDDPSMYTSVLECDKKCKMMEKSFTENTSPSQLAIEGIIDSISAVKKPCNIHVYTASTVEIEKKKGRNSDLLGTLKNLIQEKGHVVEFEKNAKLVKDTIKEVRVKQAM